MSPKYTTHTTPSPADELGDDPFERLKNLFYLLAAFFMKFFQNISIIGGALILLIFTILYFIFKLFVG
jgi:hypothetical protein